MSPSLRLNDQPQELIPGFRAWRNNNGYTAVLLHHSADPDTASFEQRRLSVPDEQQFLREHELDFSSWAGKPVYPGFREQTHVSERIGYVEGLPVLVGLDFGYHRPAAVFAQFGPPVLWVLGEVMGEDMTLFEFLSNVFVPYRDALFPEDAKFLYAADPAGRQVTDRSEHTSFSILANHGIFPFSRKAEIALGLTILRQHIALGTMQVHPRARLLIEGLKGGYRYPEPTVGVPEPLFPLKDGFYEHLADAFRYLAVNFLQLLPPPAKKQEPEESLAERFLKTKVDYDPEFGTLL